MTARSLPVAFALTLTAACSSLQAVSLEFINEVKPRYVTISDGYSLTEIANPRVDGDSMLGMTITGDRPVAIPLREVERISTVRFSSGRTVALIGGVAAFGALATYAMLAKGNGDVSTTCDIGSPIDVHEREQCGFTLTVGP